MRICIKIGTALISRGNRLNYRWLRGKVREISDAMGILTLSSIELYRRHLSGTGHEYLVEDSYYVHAFRREEAADPNALGYSLRREKGADVEKIDADEKDEDLEGYCCEAARLNEETRKEWDEAMRKLEEKWSSLNEELRAELWRE